MLDDRTRHARALFRGVAGGYDRPAAALGLGRYGAWRRALVRAVAPSPGAHVLDVATGTGLIARDLMRASARRVVGLDQSEEMLAGARPHRYPLVAGGADALPFPSAAFDAVVFSYLLRYVPDPASTLRELARVLRPGGTLASLEFGLPSNPLARAGWRAYARGVFPVLASALGGGWRAVGRFLPGSIEEWARAWPVERQTDAWRAAGIEGVRARPLTFGAAVLTVGQKRG